MNKQELIKEFDEIGIYSLNVFGVEVKGIPTETAIKLIKQLDEPETGSADEAPRYLKNILARLRELPLHNREVWLKVIMGEFKQDFSHAKWREGYDQGKFEGEWVGNQLKDADKVRRELNKAKVPQFVADWYEENKDEFELNLWVFLTEFDEENIDMSERFGIWLGDEDNNPIQTLVNMHQFGYEVDEEKRYLVKVKELQKSYNYLNYVKDKNMWVFSTKENMDFSKSHHTRKQLEDADFGWVFDCEGIEIEEVE